jgi:nitrogen regulatory protein P-II 1
MKKIEAIIRPSRLEQVKQALHLHGVDGMTISEAEGLGREKGPTLAYRGAQRQVETVPRVKIETIVDDEHADEAVTAIYQSAHTGEVGDGRIAVTDLATVIHIRTGDVFEAMHPAVR